MPPSRWASFAAEAAVPEQLVPYVRAVSDLEPLECGGFLAWRSGPALVLVGHDAGLKQGGAEQERSRPEAARLDAAVGEASSLPGIESLTVLAPFRPDAAPEWAVSTKPDAYWGIPLPTDAADMAYGQKLRNQLRRARRDILIAREGWKPDHAELVEQYIRSRPFAPGTRHLFRHIGPYVEAVPTPCCSRRGTVKARCRASPWAITRRSEPFFTCSPSAPRKARPARRTPFWTPSPQKASGAGIRS